MSKSLRIAFILIALCLLLIIVARPDDLYKPNNNRNEIVEQQHVREPLAPDVDGFVNVMGELIKEQNGIIKSIKPELDYYNRYTMYYVTLSDMWFYFTEIEKERYLMDLRTVINSYAIMNQILYSDEYVVLYVHDEYDIELAEQIMFGGFKILE